MTQTESESNWWGAQRLSASEVGSRLQDEGWSKSKMCSTPFGIRGWFTRVKAIERLWFSRAQRLSASEVGSLFSELVQTITITSAQRLSASEVGSRLCGLPMRSRLVCAQRLSASEVGSQ